MEEQQDDEATVIRPRGASRSNAPVPVDGDEDAEATLIRLIEPRPPTVRAPLPVAPPVHVPTEPAAPVVSPGVERWAVRVRGSATVVPLDRPVIVGRRPGAARAGEHPEPRRLVVPAECGDVSARHARIEQLGETLVVADLGSTNGTVVHWSNGAPLRLRPGESTAVLPDAVIELGERLILEVLPATPTPEPPS